MPPRRSQISLITLFLTILLIIFSFSRTTAAPSDDWVAPINISNNTTTPFSFSPTVAVDRLGVTHAAWAQSVSVPNSVPDAWLSTIFYSSNNGEGFSAPVALKTYQHRTTPLPISIVFDANNNPWIFWMATEVYYVRWDGSGWSAAQTLSFLPLDRRFGAEFDYRHAVAVSDEEGNIHVVVGSGFIIGQDRLIRDGLMMTSWNGSEWSMPSFITDQVAHLFGNYRIAYGSPSLAPDSHGRLHMAWFNRTGSNIYQILYSNYDGSSWTTPQVVFQSTNFQGPPEIAVDILGQPHVVWDSYVNSFHIVGRYSTLENGLWSAPEAIGEIGPVHMPKIKLDADGVAHVVYLEPEGDNRPPTGIFHVRKQQGSWTQPKQIAPFAEGGPVSLDYDALNDALHVVWFSRNSGPTLDIFYSQTVPSDALPPSSVAAVSGAVGNNGWYRGDVSVTINAADNDDGSGVQEIKYSINGQPYQTVSVPINISAEGETVISFYATDKSGNAEVPQAISIKIDKSAPAITTSATVGSGPYTPGTWTNQDVLVSFDCADVGPSGVESVSDPVTVSTEGAGQSVVGVCTDIAGNSSPTTFHNINVDKTAPVLSVPLGVTADATSSSGAVVTYTVSATDNLTASPSVNCSPQSGSAFMVGDTMVVCSASDAAGNSSTRNFNVHVKGVSEQTSDLGGIIDGFNLQQGTASSLKAKLRAAQQAIAAGNVAGACGSIDDFIAQVQAQSGKKISQSQATTLIAEAMQIKAALGCP